MGVGWGGGGNDILSVLSRTGKRDDAIRHAVALYLVFHVRVISSCH